MKNLFIIFATIMTVLPFAAMATDAVPYLDETGVQHSQDNVTVYSSSNLPPSTLTTGWYLLSGTFDSNSRITIDGDVFLILENDCDVSVLGGIFVESGFSLTIYCQSFGSDMGSLYAESSNGSGNAGIGGGLNNLRFGSVIINGGTVNAIGDDGGSGIGTGGGTLFTGDLGDITINNGTVSAQGGSNGAGIGGVNITLGFQLGTSSVTIKGGTVIAQSAVAESIGDGGTLSLPIAYTYWANTVNADPGGNGTEVPTQTAFANSNLYHYVKIDKRSLEDAVITYPSVPYAYTGNAIQPSVTAVTAGGVTVPATDYDISYTNNTSVGTTAAITVTAKAASANFTGSASVAFTIAMASPTLTMEATPAAGQTYPGDVTLTATLAGAVPLNGQTITFSVNGSNYTETTNASGTATYTLSSPSPGAYSFGASFAGDTGNSLATAPNITGYTVVRQRQPSRSRQAPAKRNPSP